ncbi:hypothetical protein ACXN5S_07010 [Pseudoroseicyclus sp. H15]
MSAPPDPTGGARAALFEAVQRVARRAGLRRALTALLAALLAGALVGAAAEIAVRANLAKPLTWTVAVAAIGAALIAGGAVFLLLWWRRPTGTALAFRIDRRAGLGQAFGTAVDVASRRDPAGPVGEVLLGHVAPQARSLDARRIEPLFPRPVVILAINAAIIVVAVLVSLALREAAAPFDLSFTPRVAQSQPEDPEAALQAAAERMAADADASGDPYLAAVARAMEDRLEEARAGGGEISTAEAEELLEHAARAYGEERPDWLGEGAGERLAGLGDRLDEAARADAARQAAEEARAALDASRPPGMYDRPPEMAERYVGRGQDELLNDPEGASGSGEASADPGLTGGGGDDEPRRMDGEDLQFAGRVPVGAALQSGRGESDMAGLGSQELQEDADFTTLEAGAGEEILLDAPDSPEGNRIRIELPPEVAEAAAEAAAAAGFASGANSAAPGEIGSRSVVSLAGRDVVARYLGRGAACEGGAC